MKPFVHARDLAVTQAVVAAFLFLLIPVLNLAGLSSHKLEGALHGIGATLTVILACRVLHLLYPLLRGQAGAVEKLLLPLWLTNGLVLLTIIFGNWLYIGYRGPDGVQAWFNLHLPAAHAIVMEYKEFVSLFPLPLGVGAAVLLHRFRSRAASVVAVLVTLAWVCLLIGFVLGLVLAKWKLV